MTNSSPPVDWDVSELGIRARDRKAMSAVAFEFDGHIRSMLAAHREGRTQVAGPVVGELLGETVDGRQISDEEMVSILRNWTVGESATISACIGIIASFIAARRVVTCPVTIGSRQLRAGDRVSLMWASANRDEQAFDQPGEFGLDRDPALNLLYGSGIHVCPGAPLARLVLRVLFEELLARFELLPQPDSPPVHALYPTAGYYSAVLELKPF